MGGTGGVGVEGRLSGNLAFSAAVGATGSEMTYDLGVRWYNSSRRGWVGASYGLGSIESGGDLGFDSNAIFGVNLTVGGRRFFGESLHIGGVFGVVIHTEEGVNDLTNDLGGFLAAGLFVGYAFPRP